MNTGNGIGSKTEHWDTPEVTGMDCDTSPSMMIVCDQITRKARVQDSVSSNQDHPILVELPDEL